MTTIATRWPAKCDVFGVQCTPTHYTEAVDVIMNAAAHRESAVVACHAVHALITFATNAEWSEKVNSFDMLTPDGQPVRWALNLLHRAKLKDRVYGPELMRRLCQRAAADQVPIYLYGGTPEVLEKLKTNLWRAFPGLNIAGAEAPPFRELTAEEDQAVVERIRSSGAGIVFIGLGCPKQDLFAYAHRGRFPGVQICVGAAFDFHAGVKPMAPQWMQRFGLEWVFRLACEPRRLWKRYFVTNSLFLIKLFGALAAQRFAGQAKGASSVRTRASGTA